MNYTISYDKISSEDISLVGGKNASLGEMIKALSKKGVAVPGGFAITTDTYWKFLKDNKIKTDLEELLKSYDREDTKSLRETGKKAREIIMKGEFSEEIKEAIENSYREMGKEYGKQNVSVAVRSSAVCEDAPDASFAGQFETFLNIHGKKELLKAVKQCIASSFSDRVIAYREEKGVPHLEFALSVGVQKMVRSDLASSGVMFTLDTESGFEKVVLINSIFGVGEMIVKGEITPDEFYVFKPTLEKGYPAIIRKDLGRKTKKYVYKNGGGLKEKKVPTSKALQFSLTDEETLTLAKWGVIIEKHYKRAQDIEWAKDGETGKLFIVQSRPETIHTSSKRKTYKEYKLNTDKDPILKGIAIGEKIGKGKVRVIEDVEEMEQFKKGDVLVTKMTDPDWVSIMRLASAIITDEGSKTAHAAIVGRELGVPTIVGTEKGTEILKDGMEVTVDCTQGLNGRVFKGDIPYSTQEHDLDKVPEVKTKAMMNIGTPETAFRMSHLPSSGVGLARVEFILAEKIQIHPLALYHYEKIKDSKVKKKIKEITTEHKDKKEHFIKELAEGIAQIAAALHPLEVIVRFSDFKSNEYENLVGGKLFEKQEENPMLGFRGASRYLDKEFEPAFRMECEAIQRCQDVFGLKNISVMVPFCRTVEEGKNVLRLMKKFGLEEGKNDLKVYIMCELPSNVIMVDQFSKVFENYSLGTNDLTQLILGLDRDNAKIAHIGDESSEAVKRTIKNFIKEAHRYGKKVSICGEAPASLPGFVEFLVECGIDSISVNPDSLVETIKKIHKQEKKNV